jgi:hypothetical protein
MNPKSKLLEASLTGMQRYALACTLTPAMADGSMFKGDRLDVANAQADLHSYRDTRRQFDLAYQQPVRAPEEPRGRWVQSHRQSTSRAAAFTADSAPLRRMNCEQSKLPIRDSGYRCQPDGKSAGEYAMSYGNIQIEIPATKLAAGVAGLEVEWSEATEVAAQ